MGKKSRRDRAAYGPLRPRGPPPRRSDDGVRLQPARREPSTQPKLTVAEAEAECRAAIESEGSSGGIALGPETHPRLFRANLALVDAIALDEDDKQTMGEYLSKCVVQGGTTAEQLLKGTMRWPRIRKYWPRLRCRV